MNVLTATNLVEELRWRGLIHTATEGAEETLVNEQVTAYIGFDPTADSLHVGHLLPIMVLVHLQRDGHTPIALAGGGTGMIGDPSGKTNERQLLTNEQIAHNVERHQARSLAHFLRLRRASSNPARMLNNADWLAPLNLIDFLRDIGKHFTVNYMLAKDSVKIAAGERGGHLLHRVQLHAAAGLRLPAPVPSTTAARSRWAAATSGATSPPGPS